MNLHFSNGRLIDPRHGIDAMHDVFVRAGRIAALGTPPPDFVADRVIDVGGKVICPGLIDLGARLPQLDSELAAAAAGGITTLVCPPDTRPVLDQPGLVERLTRRVAEDGRVRVLPLGALTQGLAGEKLAEMVTLARAGCVAFSNANRPVVDTLILLRAMQYAASHDFAVWLQPQDAHLAAAGVAHDGEVASRLGLAGIPSCAETVAVATALQLVRETGARLHLMRLSTAGSLFLLRAARAEGLPVTADVGIHHLHLTEHDIGFFDSNARFAPPLRARSDRDALRRAAAEGLVAICSDHTPVDPDGKQLPFGEAEPGASALEMLLPLTLQWAEETATPLLSALARLTADPVRILGGAAAGHDYGHLAVGAPADLCVIDLEATWLVQAETLCSAGRNTPLRGKALRGRVVLQLLGGVLADDRFGPS